ncbi:MAG: helix-turn-helix domain-containing protein [Ruminococcaceae bacterium]|nr:helix-turn-helix domain-containing protein [Oscillospiraceae bacterium]
MTIGERIAELRKGHGYSQEYVAEKLDVSRQAVSKWECDASAPDTYNLIALAELFGVSVEYIAVGKKEGETNTVSHEPAGRPVEVTNHNYYHPGLGFSQIVGIIFLICGIVCGVLGIILDEDGLIPVALTFFFCTVLFVIQIRHKSLVSMWSYWLFMFLVGVFGMTTSPFLVFNPDYYGDFRFSWNLISGYIVWIWLAVCIVYTVMYVRKLKKLKRNEPQEP